MAQTLGRAEIYVDGRRLDSMPGATLEMGGIKRKPVQKSKGVDWCEEEIHSTIECTVPVSKTSDEELLRNMAGVTVQFKTDVGKTYLVNNAFAEDTVKLEAKDGGNVKLKIHGDPAEKV